MVRVIVIIMFIIMFLNSWIAAHRSNQIYEIVQQLELRR